MRHIVKMTAEELREKQTQGSRLQLIDVRSPGEFVAVHIPGTVNIPLEQLESRLADLSDADGVVLVCRSGSRACIAHQRLDAVRNDLFVLDGGIDGWMEHELPVVSGTRSGWSIERQVRLAAGLLIMIGVLLSVLVATNWIYLTFLIGAGLTFSGFTDVCGMAALFAKMSWNRPKKPDAASGANGVRGNL